MPAVSVQCPYCAHSDSVDGLVGARSGLVPGVPRRRVSNDPRLVRTAFRSGDAPVYRNYALGFRVALVQSGR
jgi:formylglycine-generating enzyme required for sulfatase activity